MNENTFILANLTWNSKGWEAHSPDRSGFKWVASNPKHIPGESWNFRQSPGKWQYGFFENLGRDVRHFDDGGVVFFVSRNISESRQFIVGLFANAQVFPARQIRDRFYSVKAPKRFCLRLPEYLEFNDKRHVPAGKQFSRYFLYLSGREARNIFSDMLGLLRNLGLERSPSGTTLLEIARRYFPDITPARLRGVGAAHKSKSGDLQDYLKKEYDAHTNQEIIRLIKNNAKLRESFINHERVKQKVAAYLSAKGYDLLHDKHLDLCARKSRKSIIVEVKSCRPTNIDAQVRLGVAQLWYYSYLYKKKLHAAQKCLALQVEPSDHLLEYVVDHCGFDLAYLSGGSVVYVNGGKSS